MTFDKIFVYATADLASRWRPIASMSFEDMVDWRSRDVAPTVIAQLEDFPTAGPVETLFPPDFMLCRSALRRDGYKLIVFHRGSVTAPSNLDTGVLEGWERTSATPAGRTILRIGQCISYAGYDVIYAGGAYNVVDLRRPNLSDDLACAVLETDKRFCTAVSPHSYACLHLRDSTLVISYYV